MENKYPNEEPNEEETLARIVDLHRYLYEKGYPVQAAIALLNSVAANLLAVGTSLSPEGIRYLFNETRENVVQFVETIRKQQESNFP